jgi:hypothetical protein
MWNNLFIITFISFSIAIYSFTSSGINYVFIFTSSIFIIFNIIKIKKAFILKKTSLPIVVLLSFIAISCLVNLNVFRFSTFLYSIFFILLFISFQYQIKKKIQFELYYKSLIFIFILFFIEIILEQFSMIFNYRLSVNLMVTANMLTRHSSLSLEPSIGSMIVSIIFYSIQKFRTYNQFKNIILWLMYIYMMFAFNSTFGILYFLFVLTLFIKLDKKIIIRFSIIFLLIILLFNYLNIESILRLKNVLSTNNITEIATIDHSGSIRILPFYYYLKSFDFTNYHFYFGYGIDYAKNLYPTILKGIPENVNIAGFLPNFLFDYGIICFIIFIWFLRVNVIKSFFSFEFLILLITFTNANFNTQNFWLIIAILFANNYYEKEFPISKENMLKSYDISNYSYI